MSNKPFERGFADLNDRVRGKTPPPIVDPAELPTPPRGGSAVQPGPAQREQEARTRLFTALAEIAETFIPAAKVAAKQIEDEFNAKP